MDFKTLKLTPRRQEICKKLGLEDGEAVLRYYPVRYEEYKAVPFSQWKEKDTVVFRGAVISYPSTYRARRNLSITGFRMFAGEEEEVKVTIYNRPWLSLSIGEKVTVTGHYEGNNKVTALNITTQPLESVVGIQPFYPLKEGITQNDIRKIVSFVYEKEKAFLREELPSSLRKAHGLCGFAEAVEGIHFPKNSRQLLKALARFKYEEFLRFYLALSYSRDENMQGKEPKHFDHKKLQAMIASLPYELSDDQRKSLSEILQDLSSAKTMSRLLQGDVGCGKTVVAALALYADYLAGYQGALMAPTEILAQQHLQSLQEFFAGSGVKIAFLSGNSEDADDVRRRCAAGEIDLLVGTHALFSDSVAFRKLGLVVTDEQHRFGVQQRRRLREKGKDADVLLMSATPIPRTLASVLYGDMEVSSIVTMPPGRKGCDTKLLKGNSIRPILPEVLQALQEGRQIYMIAALIEQSDGLKAKDAQTLYGSLKERLAPYEVGLLHGRLDAEEKQEIMRHFAANEIQVLISTTVVEVGVNVPNATVMVVYDADRFGLSQLHQLRGRIQRSSYKGQCYLLTEKRDPDTLARLQVLCRTNNGFEVAEEDLRQRGPGDILGTRQSGLPSFVLGNPVSDTRIMQAAKEDAGNLRTSSLPEDLDYCASIRRFALQNRLE